MTVKAKAVRYYSLFAVITHGKKKTYESRSQYSFPKATAIRVFQNQLLFGALGGPEILCLRPIGPSHKLSPKQ